MDKRYPVLFMMLLLSAVTFAEQEKDDEEPDTALLEFLGEWETDKGNWVDPLDLDSLVTASCNKDQEHCNE